MARTLNGVLLLPVLLIALSRLVATLPTGKPSNSTLLGESLAVSNSTIATGTSVPVTNITVSGNSATATSVPVTNNTVSGNSATGTSVPVTNVTVSENSAAGTSVPVTNITVGGNSATGTSVPVTNNTVRGESTSTIKRSPANNTRHIDYYKTKYDHVDVEAILNNRRMVSYYAKCMLNQSPCSPDGAEFKKILPDAIRTNCLRCTDKQKAVTVRTIKRLMKEYPKIWAQLASKWDPDDVYVKQFLITYAKVEYKPPVTPPTFVNRFEDEDIKPTKNDILPNLPPLPTLPSQVLDTVEPVANNIGAGFTATVRIGNRVVGGVIREIGAVGNRVIQTGAQVGNRVIQTGAQIADVLIRSLRPL